MYLNLSVSGQYHLETKKLTHPSFIKNPHCYAMYRSVLYMSERLLHGDINNNKEIPHH